MRHFQQFAKAKKYLKKWIYHEHFLRANSFGLHRRYYENISVFALIIYSVNILVIFLLQT